MQMLRSFFDSELWQRRALDGFFRSWGGDTGVVGSKSLRSHMPHLGVRLIRRPAEMRRCGTSVRFTTC